MKLTYHMVVDTDGYHIETAPPTPQPERYDLIVRNGGKLHTRELVVPAMYEKLAGCRKTPKDVIFFCNQFGLPQGLKSIRLEEAYQMIDVLRSLLKTAYADDWLAIGKWLTDNTRVVKIFCHLSYDSEPGFKNFGKDALRPRLEFHPRNLISFIYCQFLQDKTGAKQYKLCKRPGCGNYFYYGPGTGKRNTSSYCTDTCQKSHYYQTHKGQRK